MLLFASWASVSWAAQVASPPPEEPLSLEKALSVALASHPNLGIYRGSVRSQAANVRQIAASGRPQISASSVVAETGLGEGDISDSYNTGIDLRQSLYDWGKRDVRTRAAKSGLGAAEFDLEDARTMVVEEVRDAYYNLNRRTRDIETARQSLENYQERLAWAKGFYSVGTKPKIEVTKAEADVANARMSLVRATSARDLARARLASAMGVSQSRAFAVDDILAYRAYEIAYDAAVETGMTRRSDLKAFVKRVETAEQNLLLAKKNMNPDLSGGVGYAFGGENFTDRNPAGIRASATLEIPISDGKYTTALVEQSRADLEVVSYRLELGRQNAELEIRQAWLALQDATAAVSAAEEVMRQAAETLALAKGRYKAGVGSNLEISDALELDRSARDSYVLALYEHKAAVAMLERAMGIPVEAGEIGEKGVNP